MPLFTWLLGLSAWASATHAALVYVLLQGCLDAATCIVIYHIAREIDSRLAVPASVIAAINPTQIVMTGLVYPDTPFTFAVALILWASLRWMREPSWTGAILLGVAFVTAAWIRVLILPFSIALVLFLLAVALPQRTFHVRQILQLTLALSLFAASLIPISLRNGAVYGSYALTPQGGQHLARWVVPLIWEVSNGTPWIRGYEEMERRAELLPQPRDENTFQQSRRYTQVAMEELKRLGPIPIAKAWLFGAAINLGTPAIILSPYVAGLPRTGFYATTGANPMEKVANFLFHSDNALYSWILIFGIIGVGLVRLLQLTGLAALLRGSYWAPTLLFVGWCTFILLVNGPIASPKYRLPMEPALVVMAGAGWVALRRQTKGRDQTTS